MISNCGHDENNKYHGGKAGDQTGGEWKVLPWYNRPWTCVLRHPDANVRKHMAKEARDAANNNNIGYDQWQRKTFFDEYKKAGWRAAAIKTPCETDCSQGVSSIAIGTGNVLNVSALTKISPDTYTGNMKANFKAAGFQVLTAKKYLTSDTYLLEGDVLLYTSGDNGHAVINLDNGLKVTAEIQNGSAPVSKKSNEEIANEVIAGKWGNDPKRSEDLKAAGYDSEEIRKIVNAKLKTTKPVSSSNKYSVTASSGLRVRSGPSTSDRIIKVLPYGTIVEVISSTNGWSKLTTGYYVSSTYLKKV